MQNLSHLFPSFDWHWTLSALDLWKRSNNALGTFRQSFGRYCSQSCAYSDETTWHPRWWRIPLENPWKCHFRDSKFQNVATCHDPQERVPWCESQRRLLFIIICQCYLKTFWQPCSQVHVVLDVCNTAFWIPKNIHSWWVLVKVFLIFFQSVALVQKPCRLMGFLLILKESHGGKNLSYVTMLLLLISKLCGYFHPLPSDCVFSQKLNSA